jgi:hypothetical protein
MQTGYYCVITKSEKIYKKLLDGVTFPKGTTGAKKLFKKNKKFCDGVYLIHRRRWSKEIDTLVNTEKSTGNLIPNNLIEEWLDIKDGKEKYPELFL